MKSQRNIPEVIEETPYKKKSKKKGLPRSKHKHEYITVCLHKTMRFNWMKEPEEFICKAEVCHICGRISGTCYANEFYAIIGKDTDIQNEEWLKGHEHWYVHDYFDKFAYKGDAKW